MLLPTPMACPSWDVDVVLASPTFCSIFARPNTSSMGLKIRRSNFVKECQVDCVTRYLIGLGSISSFQYCATVVVVAVFGSIILKAVQQSVNLPSN